MKSIWLHILLAVLLIPSVDIAGADQSTDSTGNYEVDLGQVYGSIQAIKYMKEICAQSFPEYINSNEVAYQKWRTKYKRFLHEMEHRFSIVMWQEANNDPEKHLVVINEFNDSMLKYKRGFEKQLRGGGEEKFRALCGLYPIYLTTDKANIESDNPEQMETIRRGPR